MRLGEHPRKLHYPDAKYSVIRLIAIDFRPGKKATAFARRRVISPGGSAKGQSNVPDH
jgi:hypothetical protein